MSRATTRVDSAILEWICTTPSPERLLTLIERHFLDSAGRLGYFRTGNSLREMTGDREGLEHVQLDGRGTLTGILQVREESPALNWDRGTLSIWRTGVTIPASIITTLEGRRLGEVVEHPLLPSDAVIVGASDEDIWLKLRCEAFCVDIAAARRRVLKINRTGVEA